MDKKYYQACYAHPNSGWAVVNTSENIPQEMVNDFSLIERANAALSAKKNAATGANDTPMCMAEIYCRNNNVGLTRTRYGISDGQGRPISFTQGFIFPDAYELLKEPDKLLLISKKNFAIQQISEEEAKELTATPGAYNTELILRSAPREEELLTEEQLSYREALETCGMSEEAYRRYVTGIYAHLLSSNSDKNLYIKTDGAESTAWKLLYLTYIAVPYSMRSRLSASTYVREEQHNTRLIFCYELPRGVPQFDPVTGVNNVMNDVLEKRTIARNPFISAILDRVAEGKQDELLLEIEKSLRIMGDVHFDSIQNIGLAYSMYSREFEDEKQLPALIVRWLNLPGKNTESWENMVSFLLMRAKSINAELGEDGERLLKSRQENAVTEQFKSLADEFLH